MAHRQASSCPVRCRWDPRQAPAGRRGGRRWWLGGQRYDQHLARENEIWIGDVVGFSDGLDRDAITLGNRQEDLAHLDRVGHDLGCGNDRG